MSTIDDKTLDKWQALADAATPGEWDTCGPEDDGAHYVRADDCDRCGFPDYRIVKIVDECQYAGERIAGDAAFVAAARTAVPALIAEARRLRAIVRDLAACDEPIVEGYNSCALCGAYRGQSDEGRQHQEHAESCPWRRAVEAVKP